MLWDTLKEAKSEFFLLKILKTILELALQNSFPIFSENPTQVQLLMGPTIDMMNSIFLLLQGLPLFPSSFFILAN